MRGGEFYHATRIPKTDAEIAEMAKAMGTSVQEIQQTLENMDDEELYKNGTYQVAVRRMEGMTHLSIKRIDKRPSRDWRDFQEIKNIFCGPECNAVEVYPAESRLVDTANQYHLWVATNESTNQVLGSIGWQERRTTNESGGGTTQRPRDS